MGEVCIDDRESCTIPGKTIVLAGRSASFAVWSLNVFKSMDSELKVWSVLIQVLRTERTAHYLL